MTSNLVDKERTSNQVDKERTSNLVDKERTSNQVDKERTSNLVDKESRAQGIHSQLVGGESCLEQPYMKIHVSYDITASCEFN